MPEKEYIEREALMTEINRIGGHNLCEWSTIGVKALVERQPTADVAEVVRCKDCKSWVQDDDVGYCDNPDGLDNYAKPNDFCSYGERKEREK